MALIPEHVIEEVLARTDIVNTVRQYVSLKKAGQNHKGLCPFHDENTPSFFVHPGMGIYKCFGCGEGGNVYQFLMALEGWSFPETVRHLADRCGVDIPEPDPEEAKKAEKKRKGKKLYLAIMEEAARFYQQRLWSDAGKAAQMYLQERGVGEETAKAFGLGFAPDGWEHLLTHMKGQGFEGRLLHRAGLAMENDRGGHYDRFRHRILFPVVDVWGHTLAFGGRALGSDTQGAKYINSPETTFYTKGEELYGLDVAKRSIQQEDFALLVEGNFDVIALHEAGLDMAVAPMGTALTERQARLMGRFARKVVIAFDGDHAGMEATRRSLPALEAAGLEARVVRFEDGDDPDTFVRREGAAALRQRIDQAPPLVAWALDALLSPVEGAHVEARIAVLEDVGELLDDVEDMSVKKYYAEEVARRLNLDPSRLNRYITRSERGRRQVEATLRRLHEPPDIDSAEFGVLVVLLDHWEWIDDFFREELDKLLSSHDLARLLELARDHVEAQESLEGSLFVESIDDPRLKDVATQALAEAQRGELYPADQSLRWYQDCVWTLKRRWSRRMAHHLEQQLEQIDFASQRDRFESLSRQLHEVRQFQQALDVDGARAQRSGDRPG